MEDKTDKPIKKIRDIEVGFFSTFFFILLVLKLTGYIDWSWIWIVGPLWMPIALLITFILLWLLLVFLGGFVKAVSEMRKDKKQEQPK